MKECSKCRHCYDDSYNFCPNDDSPLIGTLSSNVVISGRYILDQRLGKGGMGIVYRAKHKFLKSLHAIKVILPSIVEDDDELVVRFKQEAILAASINHPNVIRVTDFGVEDEIMPYLVMEFVDGTALSNFLVPNQPLSVTKAFELFQPIALGVAEAHSKGIVHRDLKPQNIMVQNGLPLRKAVKVLDFGLAKIKTADSFGSLIQAKTTSFIGSPPYMSPEQWENDQVDHRTDIYGLGIILFQMLTGNLPFQAESIPSVMYQHFTALPPSFASLGIAISPSVEAVVNKALEKDRAARYNSVEEMYRDFEKARAQSASSSSLSIETAYLNPSAHSLSANIESPTIADGKTAPLTQTQRDRLFTYFDSKTKTNLLADEQLAQEFLQAQDRAEEAQAQASQADKLVQELADAQKVAENAQQKALEAKQRIEAEVRQRVEAEMENKMAVEQQNRQKAEAERLAKEAEARKQAEERANYLAQAALEAQQVAEKERQKAEKEVHQRELAESVRRRSEIAAAQLTEQVADAKKKYEEAKQLAQYEAGLRQAAEAKRQKIETELHAIAESETERRRLAEAKAQKQIQEQASRFEQEAQAAQQQVDEARRLAEFEVKKREEAEAAKLRAEEEARRLADEILQVHRHLEEIKIHTSKTSDHQIHTSKSTDDHTLSLQDFHRSQSSRELNIAPKDSLSGNQATSQSGMSDANLKKQTVPLFQAEFNTPKDTTQIHQQSNENIGGLINTSPIKKRKSSMPLMIAGALAVFFVVAFGGVGAYYFATRQPAKSEVSNVNKKIELPNNNSSATPILETKDKMVLIEGGTFQMGRSDVSVDDPVWGSQYPAHTVSVKSFYIDKTEVSNAEYAEFIQAEKHAAPSNWNNGKPPEGEEKFPVTNVSLDDAKAYAAWISSREKRNCQVPTEEEWEFAARNGAKSTTYPWGDDWVVDKAILASDNKKASEVGTSLDETLNGVKDMLGNVIEWTSSKYTPYPNSLKELKNKDSAYFVIRGSSWGESKNRLKDSKLMLTRRQSVEAETQNPFLGFRLVCQP